MAGASISAAAAVQQPATGNHLATVVYTGTLLDPEDVSVDDFDEELADDTRYALAVMTEVLEENGLLVAPPDNPSISVSDARAIVQVVKDMEHRVWAAKDDYYSRWGSTNVESVPTREGVSDEEILNELRQGTHRTIRQVTDDDHIILLGNKGYCWEIVRAGENPELDHYAYILRAAKVHRLDTYRNLLQTTVTSR